ncbi:hypothetical protein KXD97_19145 [Mycobacterium sp. SMC-8]|uniref:hypothetical protein n=1 Tax=Mycobacterium sp. SMC-8 TaxID=2857060 RepID=UPI0021B33968|nr:hypothetical protein [Mycobacterium sp. SMC-8]UXA10253.1 hypothetical protein KXD97_19145 [Mycobacterium sp. SMC-8]
MTELRADPTIGDRTLVAINQRVHEAVTTTLKLYDLIRAAKDLGYSFLELEAATGFARGTLQNIVDGKNPRFSVEREIPCA